MGNGGSRGRTGTGTGTGTGSGTGSGTGTGPVTEERPGSRAYIEGILGQRASDRQLAGLVGALPGEQVSVRGTTIRTTTADGAVHFIMVYRSDGAATIGNGGHQLPGSPAIVSSTDPARLAEQVRAARSLGIDSIFVKSSGDAASYRLAQMGFDRQLSAIVPHETKDTRLPAALAGVQSLQGLMATAAGRAWVRDHLHTPGLYFAVTPRSASMRAFTRFRHTDGQP
jgi:hypothetical protein